MYNIFLVRGYKVFGPVIVHKDIDNPEELIKRFLDQKYSDDLCRSNFCLVKCITVDLIGETNEIPTLNSSGYCGQFNSYIIDGKDIYYNIQIWSRN